MHTGTSCWGKKIEILEFTELVSGKRYRVVTSDEAGNWYPMESVFKFKEGMLFNAGGTRVLRVFDEFLKDSVPPNECNYVLTQSAYLAVQE